MVLRFFYPIGLVATVILCLPSQSASQDKTSAQFSCYQGSFTSNERGEIQLHSDKHLSLLPCEEEPIVPPSPTSQPTITTNMTAAVTAGSQNHSQPTSAVTPLTTSQPPNASASFMCAMYKYFPSGSKLSPSVKWTANFTCVPPAEKCPEGKFCCYRSKCNSLHSFMQDTGSKWATVSTCFKGSRNNSDITGSVVKATNCAVSSQFCFNRTTGEVIQFGCSLDNMQIACRNITVGGNSMCVNANGSFLCCCASDNCNAPPQNASVLPTHSVPTTPYLVTASKPTSNWMLVLFIAAGVLIGGLVGAASVILYRKWKKKRNNNGPLNISYSRVSADFANEDDDNIFSY